MTQWAFIQARSGVSTKLRAEQKEIVKKAWRRITFSEYSDAGIPRKRYTQEEKENMGKDEFGRDPDDLFYGRSEAGEKEFRNKQVIAWIEIENEAKERERKYQERKAAREELKEKLKLGGVAIDGTELGPPKKTCLLYTSPSPRDS